MAVKAAEAMPFVPSAGVSCWFVFLLLVERPSGVASEGRAGRMGVMSSARGGFDIDAHVHIYWELADVISMQGPLSRLTR